MIVIVLVAGLDASSALKIGRDCELRLSLGNVIIVAPDYSGRFAKLISQTAKARRPLGIGILNAAWRAGIAIGSSAAVDDTAHLSSLKSP